MEGCDWSTVVGGLQRKGCSYTSFWNSISQVTQCFFPHCADRLHTCVSHSAERKHDFKFCVPLHQSTGSHRSHETSLSQGCPGTVPIPRMHACSVTQSCPTLCDPMDYRPPGSSAHGIFKARILERVAIYYSRGSSQPRD